MSIRGLANAKIVSWLPRTGSDAAGVPTFGAEQIVRPIPCVAAEPNHAQIKTAERETFALDIVITVEASVAIALGDRLMCDHPNVAGRTLEVNRHGVKSKRGLGGLVLMCAEVKT